MLVIILFVVSVLTVLLGWSFSKIYALEIRLKEIEQKSTLSELGFRNRTRDFLDKNHLSEIERKMSRFFTSDEAVHLFEKAVGAIRKKVEDLEKHWKMRSEFFLTKETAQDLFKEYQEMCVEEYKKFKDERWDRLTEAFKIK